MNPSLKKALLTCLSVTMRKSQTASLVKMDMLNCQKNNDLVYVLPAQVMPRQVNVTYIRTDVHLLMNEYQWFSDSIGQF